jgi:hypothetical protein
MEGLGFFRNFIQLDSLSSFSDGEDLPVSSRWLVSMQRIGSVVAPDALLREGSSSDSPFLASLHHRHPHRCLAGFSVSQR